MNPTLTARVQGHQDDIFHECSWQNGRSAPEFTVELPAEHALTLALDSGRFGQVRVEGDLEIDPAASPGSTRTFRWNRSARGEAEGEAEITLVHAHDGFNDVVVSVSMAEEASLEVDDVAATQLYTGMDVVDRYAAYAVGFLAAIVALIAAYFMPACASKLIVGAGVIAVVNFFYTEQYDAFALRLLGMVAAGAALVAAFIMPEHTNELLSAAGTIAVVSLVWG